MNKFQYCFFSLSLSCYKQVFRKYIVFYLCTHTSNCEQFWNGQVNISLYGWLIDIITDNSYQCRLCYIQLCLHFRTYQKWPGLSILTYSFKDNFWDHSISHTFWVWILGSQPKSNSGCFATQPQVTLCPQLPLQMVTIVTLGCAAWKYNIPSNSYMREPKHKTHVSTKLTCSFYKVEP